MIINKAPAKESMYQSYWEPALLFCLCLLVWAGPVLKLIGVCHYSWWVAFSPLLSIWGVALLVWLATLLIDLVAKYLID